MRAIEEWERRGERRTLAGHQIFVIDRPADTEGGHDPVLILHGFPSCSFDWRHVVDAIGASRRVVLLDFLGYGLSAKPHEQAYSLFEQADIVEALVADSGLDRFALLTHDMGDSVGGEVLARDLDAGRPDRVRARVITNGSIYMDLVQLSPGQELLLSLPDAPMPAAAALGADLLKPGLAATFGPATQPDDEELEAQWRLVERDGGHLILPRLIRYVEERRRHEPRWTGAIETHPSPLTILWGDLDPIAVVAMAERLAAARPDATLIRLEGIGHYPMIEAAPAFAAAVVAALDRAPQGRGAGTATS